MTSEDARWFRNYKWDWYNKIEELEEGRRKEVESNKEFQKLEWDGHIYWGQTKSFTIH